MEATMNMTRMELNNNEQDLVNGGITIRYLRKLKEEQERIERLVYPKMDVDNRPAIDLSLHRPTLPQA